MRQQRDNIHNPRMTRVEVADVLVDTVLPVLMDHLFNEDGPWDQLEQRLGTWRMRRTTFDDIMAVRHTCASWMRYVGCTLHFAAMRMARVDTMSLRPLYWIPLRDYLQDRFRNSYMTFTTTDGWQKPPLLSQVLAAGPLVDWELDALRLILQGWSSVPAVLRARFLSATDCDVRSIVLRLAIWSLT
jgi:hypothetical protein